MMTAKKYGNDNGNHGDSNYGDFFENDSDIKMMVIIMLIKMRMEAILTKMKIHMNNKKQQHQQLSNVQSDNRKFIEDYVNPTILGKG